MSEKPVIKHVAYFPVSREDLDDMPTEDERAELINRIFGPRLVDKADLTGEGS